MLRQTMFLIITTLVTTGCIPAPDPDTCIKHYQENVLTHLNSYKYTPDGYIIFEFYSDETGEFYTQRWPSSLHYPSVQDYTNTIAKYYDTHKALTKDEIAIIERNFGRLKPYDKYIKLEDDIEQSLIGTIETVTIRTPECSRLPTEDILLFTTLNKKVTSVNFDIQNSLSDYEKQKEAHDQLWSGIVLDMLSSLSYTNKVLPSNDPISVLVFGNKLPTFEDEQDGILKSSFDLCDEPDVSLNECESLQFISQVSPIEQHGYTFHYLSDMNITLLSQADKQGQRSVLWESSTIYYAYDMVNSNHQYPSTRYERFYDGSTRHTHFNYTNGYEDLNITEDYNLSKVSNKLPQYNSEVMNWIEDELDYWHKADKSLKNMH